MTRDFLFNLDQNGAKLPAGPVIISPDGILPSLFREMILKRPDEFKIASLQVRSLLSLSLSHCPPPLPPSLSL